MFLHYGVRRFTPTGVGTMSRRSRPRRPTAVHPHGRGDNARSATAPVARLTVHPHGRGDNRRATLRRSRRNGSPPRAWGQSAAPQRRRCTPRFTPTGVGTMGCWWATQATSPVHPHGRGDNAKSRGKSRNYLGSPPRAWGQCFNRSLAVVDVRFTPTGVGTIRVRC